MRNLEALFYSLVDPGWWVLISLALLAIFHGAFYSVPRGHLHSQYLQEITSHKNQMQLKWIIILPVIGSLFLLLLFFLWNYIHYVALAFLLLGSFLSINVVFFPHFKTLVSKISILPPRVRLPFKQVEVPTEILFVVPFAITLILTWVFVHHWTLTNLLTLTMAAFLIQSVQMPNLKFCLLLLTLFMIYDIFWVFISPLFFKKSVMSQVAISSIDLPVLITFPHVLSRGFSLLGNGDIALPGLYLSFLYRFDCMKNFSQTSEWRKVKSGYFLLGCIGYAVALNIAMTVQTLFFRHSDTGQPALLYLVPCTLIPTTLLAYKRDQLRELWNPELAHEYQALNQPDSDVELSEAPKQSLDERVDDEVIMEKGQDLDQATGSGELEIEGQQPQNDSVKLIIN